MMSKLIHTIETTLLSSEFVQSNYDLEYQSLTDAAYKYVGLFLSDEDDDKLHDLAEEFTSNALNIGEEFVHILYALILKFDWVARYSDHLAYVTLLIFINDTWFLFDAVIIGKLKIEKTKSWKLNRLFIARLLHPHPTPPPPES